MKMKRSRRSQPERRENGDRRSGSRRQHDRVSLGDSLERRRNARRDEKKDGR
jgi:hypothetical protein